jgi:hypothetical protein
MRTVDKQPLNWAFVGSLILILLSVGFRFCVVVPNRCVRLKRPSACADRVIGGPQIHTNGKRGRAPRRPLGFQDTNTKSRSSTTGSKKKSSIKQSNTTLRNSPTSDSSDDMITPTVEPSVPVVSSPSSPATSPTVIPSTNVPTRDASVIATSSSCALPRVRYSSKRSALPSSSTITTSPNSTPSNQTESVSSLSSTSGTSAISSCIRPIHFTTTPSMISNTNITTIDDDIVDAAPFSGVDASTYHHSPDDPASPIPSGSSSEFMSRSASRSPVRKRDRRTSPFNRRSSPSSSSTTTTLVDLSSLSIMVRPRRISMWHETTVIRTALVRMRPWLANHMTTNYDPSHPGYHWVAHMLARTVPRVCPYWYVSHMQFALCSC